MIEIQSVTKRYESRYALEKVSLSLAANKTHALLGSSGSGKSTLLRAILRLIPYDEGKILIGGVEVASMNSSTRAKHIGYVPQYTGLFPHLTCRDNITIVGRSLNWDKQKIDARLSELRKVAPLEDSLLARYPNELSGGQKQRVAVLRSLFLDPELILLDEPFAALDPLIRSDIQAEVKELFRRLKKTVVMVTHDVGEANFLADNIILMHEGRVIQQGRLEDLVNNPAAPFVDRFLNAQRVFDLRKDTL